MLMAPHPGEQRGVTLASTLGSVSHEGSASLPLPALATSSGAHGARRDGQALWEGSHLSGREGKVASSTGSIFPGGEKECVAAGQRLLGPGLEAGGREINGRPCVTPATPGITRP